MKSDKMKIEKKPSEKDITKAMKKYMVENQIKARGINDENVLKAFLKVDRHLFVDEENLANAYDDNPLPIGSGQTISQPYIVAYMANAMNLTKHDKVLEIGTGSGYQTAILAELCSEVFTVEIFESLGNQAKILLSKLGYQNISLKIGDGNNGWQEYSPFDAIIVSCAAGKIPQQLIGQLNENGRMIIPIGKIIAQELIILRKKNNMLLTEESLKVRFVPMIDSSGRKY
jgi:protein-L-isoaspartate(D-aspartate) O-methyltransferase